jgi:hypothetical protein
MGQLLWKKHYKYWKLYYAEGSSFFAYKGEKAYVKDQELRYLAIIKYRTYPDIERRKPCEEFEKLQKLGLIKIRWINSMGYLSRYCFFDITWEPYEQIPPLIIARTLIDGLGWRAFHVSIYDEWDDYLARFDVTKWEWDALKKVLVDIPTEGLPEFLAHDCPAISDVAGEVISKRYAKRAYQL